VVGYTPSNAGGKVFSAVNSSVSTNGATLANTGGDATWGVNWGSWQGGLATVNGNATSGSTHLVQSTNLTSAAQLAAMPSSLVSASYSYVGGPPPTDQLGNTGTINSLSVAVNFSSQTVTNYAVNATINATTGVETWSASGSGSVANFSGASGIGISGKCSGCSSGAGAPTANGTANGAFVGSAAERMITSFGMKAANQAMSGAAYLSR
jgi:hypothetical protein